MALIFLGMTVRAIPRQNWKQRLWVRVGAAKHGVFWQCVRDKLLHTEAVWVPCASCELIPICSFSYTIADGRELDCMQLSRTSNFIVSSIAFHGIDILTPFKVPRSCNLYSAFSKLTEITACCLSTLLDCIYR